MEVIVLVDVLGILGMALLLGSFTLSAAATVNNSVRDFSTRWASLYSLSNFIGAAMLAYYAYALDNLIFLILESTWSAVGLFAVLQKMPLRRKATAPSPPE